VYTFRRHIVFGVVGTIAVSILAFAAPANASDTSVVTVYADGEEHVITTDASTVREVLERTGVEINESDIVEPSPDTEITSKTFNVNVYRARPVIIKDKDKDRKYRVESAHQSPRLIAEEAKAVSVYEEDKLDYKLVTDFLDSDFIGHKVIIDRATPVNVKLVNRETVIRTHASTVKGMFEESDIELKENDVVKPGLDKSIDENMDVTLIRRGFKTITKEETIRPPTKTIRDNDRPLEYEKIEEQGKPGRALVTYKVEYRNGEKVNSEKIRRVVEEKPKPKVVVVGNEIDNAWQRLADCESGDRHVPGSANWSINTGNGFYGGLQFHPNTWNRYGGNEYAEYAHQATRNEQIEIARRVRDGWNGLPGEGWGAWPDCSSFLGLE
jgi:uncharacterized protein YabE (DUF348 family)